MAGRYYLHYRTAGDTNRRLLFYYCSKSAQVGADSKQARFCGFAEKCCDYTRMITLNMFVSANL